DYMDLREVATISDSMLGEPYFDTDNVWGTSQVDLSQRIGAEVHYGLAKTWDYFKQRHDRNGIANDGKGMRAIANIASANSEFTNAFWMDGLNTMFYLNGSAEDGSNPVIEIDVAGHEMTHGVTHATAMLLSSEDSGGLNEATSDIFGTMVEFFDNNPKQPPNYLLGEHVFVSGKPFRYMFKPSLDAFPAPNGRQYASYDCYPKSGFDNTVDEHLSSGTGNHFFYLLSEGAVVPKSHQSTLTKADLVCNGNTALRGITNRTAAQIWYRALTLYMTESTTYPQAREATQQAAMDLKERGLLSAWQVDAVACAWEAVDVPLPKGSRHKGCLRL
ncbi:MAG TPA: M4 family metallopeptidase, partial [Pseudoxanthomonas sp.]|nr:M4 family metallopeptidase [Pseudoxanthomonas sp.]